jgi:hypothetical protein
VENDIETLAIALYVKIDDMLKKWPDLAPARPEGTIPPTVSDAELLTMAVMSALLGFTSERRWLRYVTKNLPRHVPAADRAVRVQQADPEGVLAVHPGDPDARDGHDAVER